MLLSATGFSKNIDFRVVSFAIDTQLAIQWVQASNGDWYPTDRGAANDYYESKVSMKGQYEDIKDVLVEINNNRVNGSNIIHASNFVSDEKIFGADIVYDSSLDFTVLEFPDIEQKSLAVFTITMSIRLLKPFIFTSTSTIPELRLAQTGYDAKIQEHTITKYDSYKGAFSYIDEKRDSGVFKGTFIFNDIDMARIRRFNAVSRGASFTVTDIPGVYFPFGPNGQVFPIDVRLKKISNEKIRDVKYWLCDVELVNFHAKNI